MNDKFNPMEEDLEGGPVPNTTPKAKSKKGGKRAKKKAKKPFTSSDRGAAFKAKGFRYE